MTKVLIRVHQDGNGLGDRPYHVATSNSEEALVEYCREAFDMPVGKPKKFSWDDYFIINDTPVVIIPDKLMPVQESSLLNVEVDSLWDYDRSLCQSQNYIGLKVKSIEGGCVTFYEKMAYKGYGLLLFNGKTFIPHVL